MKRKSHSHENDRMRSTNLSTSSILMEGIKVDADCVDNCKNNVRKQQKTEHRNRFNGELGTQDTQYAGETKRA